MYTWSLVKKDDRSFVNPFLSSDQQHSWNQTDEEFLKHLKSVVKKLMAQWEKHVKAEIDYTGSTNWSDYSVYTGKSGYALLYFEAGKMLNSPEYIEQAFFMAEKCTMHLHKPNAKDLTFLTGVSGPLALAAACAHSLRQPEKEHHFLHRLQTLYRSFEVLTNSSDDMPDELLYGRAGCLFSLLYMKQHCHEKVNDDLIASVAKAIIGSGRRLANEMQLRGFITPPLMFEWHKQKYLGPAHGFAGILYLLLQITDYLEPGVVEDDIRLCLDFLLETRFPSGNFPSSLDSERDRLVQWCHGAPGFIHCFIAAAKVYNSDLYLSAAKQCADVTWERGILTKGVGLCHGISGNALAILHLYKHTKDPVYLYRAYKFSEIVMDDRPHEFRTPDRPLSLFEGTAGVILFLMNLLDPEKFACSFPGYQLNALDKK
ncbi:glutathione S-transferase LANCL1 [Daphnia magna]|uniref:glutathione S-transferase LANCL1 n=1 Tax=Daphnia magna TaxID=35525 RepID=UPI0006DEDCEB|nr:glutathione S-transferase LANCL1 [Daphnia magna]